MNYDEFRSQVQELQRLASQSATDAEGRMVIARIAALTRRYRITHGIGLPSNPVDQAREMRSEINVQPHLEYLNDRVRDLTQRVEAGENCQLAVSMPPRAGKSTLLSYFTPLWMLRRNPDWKIIETSHDSALTSGWARMMRENIEGDPSLGIALKKDGGAHATWTTEEGGGMYATSVRTGLTGRGARVLIIDDPIANFVDAHSLSMRQNLWDWWLTVAQTRMEPPYFVLVVMTRWHEDDFVGRLMSPDFEGDPDDWEYIRLPALAERDDVIGRSEGEPLFSPMNTAETNEQALARWDATRRSVGSYAFAGLYQQRPAPAQGAIFDSNWWRYWTHDPNRATEDGKVVYLDPDSLKGAAWCDSWDASFKSSLNAVSGWVVGQRWAKLSANRYLISQKRGRWSFTDTLREIDQWAATNSPGTSPYGHLVHDRLVEERANGAAIIDTMREKISGLKPINPTQSKEARARAITPEVESGNVFVPLPSEPGNEWVSDFLSELRNFPNDVADDQVDALTQALSYLRTSGRGSVTVPGSNGSGREGWQRSRNVTQAAMSDQRRHSNGRVSRSR